MGFGLTLSTPPTIDPVGLAELREALRLDSGRDRDLKRLIQAARQYAEIYLGRQLCTATWLLKLDAFPANDGAIRPPRPPLASVTSIGYTDSDGDAQTLDAEKYTVDTDTEPGRIVPAFNETWPSTRAAPNAVTVTYVAGYGSAADVPQTIRQGIIALVGHWNEYPEPVIVGGAPAKLPLHVEALLNSERIIEVR